jgi:ubiquinone biosynthesis protein COQ9
MSEIDRDRLIETLLTNVGFDGWTQKALTQTAEQMGISRGELDLALPRGIGGAVDAMADWADRQALDVAAEQGEAFEGARTRDKIAFLVRVRLEALEPYREAVRRALVVLTRPSQVGLAPRLAWRTADRLWHAAGDRASDHNHYTKRALLVGVMGSTQLYWLNDRSDEREASWAFLDRRIEEVLRVGRNVGQMTGRLGPLTEAPFRLAARLRQMAVGRPADGG